MDINYNDNNLILFYRIYNAPKIEKLKKELYKPKDEKKKKEEKESKSAKESDTVVF